MTQRKVKGPKEAFEALYRSLGQRQGQAILSELLEAESLKPTLTMSRLAAYVVAGSVHLVTLSCLVLSIGVLVWVWPDFWWILVLAVPCFLLTWALRPRLPKIPRFIVDRAEFPALYRFVDSVAAALEAPPVDGIVINEQFNASFVQAGWRRRRILTLGLPLWVVLDEREKVALVAHELAHGINGDLNRGLFVGSALHSLTRWHSFLRPADILDVPPEDWIGIRGLLMIPFNILMLCLSMLPRAAAQLLIHLLWRDSQRAEYLSDCLAAQVSGRSGMLSLLEKLYLSPVFKEMVQRQAHRHDRNVKFFDDLADRATKLSSEGLARIKEEDRGGGGRFDVTHPPTAYRIELVEKRGPTSDMISQLEWSDEVEEAFRVNAPRMQGRLLGEYYFRL